MYLDCSGCNAGPAKSLHSMHSTLSQDIIRGIMSPDFAAGAVPCHHTVDSITAQQFRVAQVCSPTFCRALPTIYTHRGVVISSSQTDISSIPYPYCCDAAEPAAKWANNLCMNTLGSTCLYIYVHSYTYIYGILFAYASPAAYNLLQFHSSCANPSTSPRVTTSWV